MVQDSGSPCVVASIEQARLANPECPIRMSVHGSEPFIEGKNERASQHTRPRQGEKRTSTQRETRATFPVHNIHDFPFPKRTRGSPPITPTTSCNATNKELANSFPLGLGAQHLSLHRRHRGAARRDNNA